MPRLRFVEDRELDAAKRALIASAERTGAPDPRVVRIMVRSSAGMAWVKCWNSVLSPREKAALHYADLFKSGDDAIDSDAVYQGLRKHFSEEEIIELGMLCAQTVGVGRLVRSLNIVSWEEACELNPVLMEKA